VFESLLIPFLVLLVAAAAGYYVYVRRRKRRGRVAEILSGANLLAHWTYAPGEWRRAVGEEFTWARNKNSVGHVYISPTTLYIKNDSEDRLIDLGGGGKVVTHASYSGIDMSPLKLRVRWKVIYESPDRPDEVKYYKEDYRIPVPLRHQEEARRVVDFFTARHEKNLDAYADVVSDDEPISIFGKDSF
jgi:hypothetical protein